MKVIATLNLGSGDYPSPEHRLKAGEEREVSDHIGELMIRRGHAVLVPAPPPAPKQPDPPPVVVPPVVESAPEQPAKPVAAPQKKEK